VLALIFLKALGKNHLTAIIFLWFENYNFKQSQKPDQTIDFLYEPGFVPVAFLKKLLK